MILGVGMGWCDFSKKLRLVFSLWSTCRFPWYYTCLEKLIYHICLTVRWSSFIFRFTKELSVGKCRKCVKYYDSNFWKHGIWELTGTSDWHVLWEVIKSVNIDISNSCYYTCIQFSQFCIFVCIMRCASHNSKPVGSHSIILCFWSVKGNDAWNWTLSLGIFTHINGLHQWWWPFLLSGASYSSAVTNL
jgi:hypothetical protein